MNNKIKLMTALAVLMSFPVSALAESDEYICEIDGLVETWGDEETASYWLQRHKGDNVLVDRSTGQVQHAGVGNTFYERIQLLHEGDAENAFKVISSSNNGWQAHYMTVEAYAEGEEKRFIIVEGGNVWRGICG